MPFDALDIKAAVVDFAVLAENYVLRVDNFTAAKAAVDESFQDS